MRFLSIVIAYTFTSTEAAYKVVGSAGKGNEDFDRDTPPQFFLPGSLTPADVTKWGSGCSRHCLKGFSGACQLCGSTACRVAPHEFECRQYKHCSLNVPHICKKGEDCEKMQIMWWQTCWTSPCTTRCWYKGSVGNDAACDECCDMACRNDDKFIGNSCFRCTLCKSRWGPHSWGKLSPEAKFHGHVCWGKDKTKGVIMESLKGNLPETAHQIITSIVVGSNNGKPNKNSGSIDHADVGISQTNAGAFATTGLHKPQKLELDDNINCMKKYCIPAKKSAQAKGDAVDQAKYWNKCKECLCWVNPDLELCEAVDCHISCKSSWMSGESCLACTRCKTCPGVSYEKDTMSNAVEALFSRDEAGMALEEGFGFREESDDGALMMGERTVNSNHGYTHKVSGDTTKAMKQMGILNVFAPKCKKCTKMGEQQSCRESCAAYKRNPQNHIAAHNCKVGKCAAKLAGACKKCIRECNNIKTVRLAAADTHRPDLGETTFEACYNTFGCANDCDAALKKVRGTLQKTSSVSVGAVGDMKFEEQVQWAFDFPFQSLQEARVKGYFANGEMKNILDNIAKSKNERPVSTTEWKRNGWWWPLE